MSEPTFHGLRTYLPDGKERAAGMVTEVQLRINRHLKSGKLDKVVLSEDELIRLIADAGRALAQMRGV